MIKNRIFLTIIILIILSPIALGQTENTNDYNDYSNLKLSFNLDGKFSIVGTSSDSQIEEVTTYLSFFPREYELQKVTSLNYYSSPNAKITQDGVIVYRWESPKEENFNFGLNSQVNINNALITIDKKIPFPLEGTFNEYTSATQFIDITQDIENQAEELAAGEDDLYVVAFKTAYWIQQNIAYNLTTLTADVVEKSSWVLKNKQGVCDELTNLFISMMRSMGIPARFVSGMAYTNLGNKWGPHAWAEVYFPDKGWVPFDITYGEFGWLDPTHIKLKVSEDSGEAAVKYNWKSIDTSLEGRKIELNTKLIEVGQKISSPIELKIRSLINNVGPGSFVPIELEIENNNDYYVADSFVITKGPNLTERNFKAELLKPGETKKLFWIAQIPKNAEKNYIYFSTLEGEDQQHKVVSTNITYSYDGERVQLWEAQKLIEENSQSEQPKIVSSKLSITCNGPGKVLTYEPIKINCNLKNKGNIRLDNINVCYLKYCQTIDLSIADEKEINFSIENLKVGIQTLFIEATNDITKASDIVTIEVIEGPEVRISNINYPQIVNYSAQVNISLVLTTKTPVKEIKIKLNNEDIAEIQSLESTKQLVIATNAKNLLHEDNLKLDIEFKDFSNKVYSINNSYPIKVINIPWYIKILAFFRLI